MLATALIVLREVVEAALIVSIVLAATRGIAGSRGKVALGIAGGIAGAIIVSVFAETISDAAAGMGQELFNAIVVFLAVLMLGWHNVWMSRHGREMAATLSAVGAEVRGGQKSLWALTVVVMLAVLREGSELVLFLYGIASADPGQTTARATGFALGLLAGMAMALAMYFGLLRIRASHIFTFTGWLIVLVAAGLAAQGAAYLVQADMLPAWGESIWDTSGLLPDDSVAGKVLHTLIGYTARPYGIQLAFYLATLGILLLLTHMASKPPGNDGETAKGKLARQTS